MNVTDQEAKRRVAHRKWMRKMRQKLIRMMDELGYSDTVIAQELELSERTIRSLRKAK